MSADDVVAVPLPRLLAAGILTREDLLRYPMTDGYARQLEHGTVPCSAKLASWLVEEFAPARIVGAMVEPGNVIAFVVAADVLAAAEAEAARKERTDG